jgi:glycosyltransferase involved in cell wall biosynthesis
MRLAFISKRTPGFTTRTPLRQPLGGTQSALCYLCAELAQRGHEVSLFTTISTAVEEDGVRCLPHGYDLAATVRAERPDVVVFSQLEEDTRTLRRALNVPTVTWYATAPDFRQHNGPALDAHDGERGFDHAVFLTRWHRDEMARLHSIPDKRAHFIHFGVAPPFLFPGLIPEEVLDRKQESLRLAYTSTPFRGLDLLCDLCEEDLSGMEGLVADVFSSMKVYEGDDRAFAPLYERVRCSPRMRHRGSVGQQELAQELLRTAVLAYPNTYPETFCLAVAEAMAAGCFVITSALGSLPEVTAGYSELVPSPGDRLAYRHAFAGKVRAYAEAVGGSGRQVLRTRLVEQIRFVRATYAWPVLARSWESLFARIAGAA